MRQSSHVHTSVLVPFGHFPTLSTSRWTSDFEVDSRSPSRSRNTEMWYFGEMTARECCVSSASGLTADSRSRVSLQSYPFEPPPKKKTTRLSTQLSTQQGCSCADTWRWSTCRSSSSCGRELSELSVVGSSGTLENPLVLTQTEGNSRCKFAYTPGYARLAHPRLPADFSKLGEQRLYMCCTCDLSHFLRQELLLGAQSYVF